MSTPERSKSHEAIRLTRRGVVRTIGLGLVAGPVTTIAQNLTELTNNNVIGTRKVLTPEEKEQQIKEQKMATGIIGLAGGISILAFSTDFIK